MERPREMVPKKKQGKMQSPQDMSLVFRDISIIDRAASLAVPRPCPPETSRDLPPLQKPKEIPVLDILLAVSQAPEAYKGEHPF